MSTEIVIPSLGLTMEEAKILEWHKKEGDEVDKDELILEIETDKAVVEVEAPVQGILSSITAQAGDVVPVGHTIAIIYSHEEYKQKDDVSGYTDERGLEQDTSSESSNVLDHNNDIKESEKGSDEYHLSKSDLQNKSNKQVQHTPMIFASPSARRVARELQVDLKFVKGSGPNGRILESNVRSYWESHSLSKPKYKTEPISNMRKVIAERMVTSHQSTSPVTIFATLRMDEVVRLRKQMNTSIERKEGFSINYDAIFVKAVALALGEFPILQAQWNAEGLLFPDNINIGIAVALNDGLVVPVVPNVESKSLFSIAKEIQHLVSLAKSGELLPDQMNGGTFTISNLGMYSIDGFTPVINLPESAILGIGSIKEHPVVEGNSIIIGQTAEISLTFDHRVVDGVPAAGFLQLIKSLLEEPYQLFM